MREFMRRNAATAFAVCTLIILILGYVPIIRAHAGWEDEIYWASTCLSMLRHRGAIPSVLVDYARPVSPLRFYGPTLFWLAAGALKIFGFSMRTWRSFAFAGMVVYLAAMALLFYRLRRSGAIAMGAALFSSLSMSWNAPLVLPGRPDFWTLSAVVLALAVVATEGAEDRPPAVGRWLGFGAVLGVAASTTPRVWPLLGLMVLLLPLLAARGRVLAMSATAVSLLATWALILIPLRMTPWSFVASVRRMSVGDVHDVSPLMGGNPGFGHSVTNIFYCLALLATIAIIELPRWRQVTRFERWLIVVAVVNMAATLALTARALNMLTYWGFLLEIAALYAWTDTLAPKRALHAGRALGVVLCVFLVALRAAKELPTLMHWHERDPAIVERELRAYIPVGSVVYGLPGRYFYPALAIGADYRHPVDWSSMGRASTPGLPGLPAPMRDACRAPVFLVWPEGTASMPLPPLPYVTPTHIASYANPEERRSVLERAIESVPGGRSDEPEREFAIYRLTPNAEYCREAAHADQ